MNRNPRYLAAACILFILLSGCGSSGSSVSFEQMARMKAKRADQEQQQESESGTGAVEAPYTQVAATPSSQPTSKDSSNIENSSVESSSTRNSTDVASAPSTGNDPNEETVTDAPKPTTSAATTPQEHRQRVTENLKRIGQAINAYRANHGSYPKYTFNRKNEFCLGWRVVILPELGYDELFQQFKLDEPYDSPANLRAAKQIPIEYQDPSLAIPKENTRVLGAVGSGTAIGLIDVPSVADAYLSEEKIDPGTFITAFESAPEASVLWTSNQDPIYVPGKPTFQPSTYETGGIVLFGDGEVMEVAPETEPEILVSLFELHQPCFRSRFTHATNVQEAGQDAADAVAATEDPQPQPAEEEIQEILLGNGQSAQQLAEKRKAEQEARTNLVFDATEKYLQAGRFSDAKLTHVASLIIGDEDLTQRYRWASQLKRPVYGFDVVLGVVSLGQSDIERIELSLKETPDQMPAAEADFYKTYGKPGYELVALLRQAQQAGRFGIWQQAIGTPSGLNQDAIAKESGELVPGVIRAPAYNQVSGLLEYSQSVDADLLLVLHIERSGDTSFQSEWFDVASRKSLGTSRKFRVSDYMKHLRAPLSEDPLARWKKQTAELLAEATETTTLPSIGIDEARDQLRRAIARSGEINRLKDILDSKFYFQVGSISALEHAKVVARLLAVEDAQAINDRDIHTRLSLIEHLLPVDWTKPKTTLKNTDGEQDN